MTTNDLARRIADVRDLRLVGACEMTGGVVAAIAHREKASVPGLGDAQITATTA